MRRSPAARQPQSQGKSRGSTLLGLFIGLVIGVLGAFGVVWYLNKTPLPFQDKSGRADRPAERPAANGKPDQLPGKPGDKVGEKPRFEFYKILPGGQDMCEGKAQARAFSTPSSSSQLALKASSAASTSSSSLKSFMYRSISLRPSAA